ncbi:MAG: DUF3638 domain-containing protein [Chlamydiales bacterium]|nr:DUF3638 domain-containing protein [Chlamydiales bacterium]
MDDLSFRLNSDNFEQNEIRSPEQNEVSRVQSGISPALVAKSMPGPSNVTPKKIELPDIQEVGGKLGKNIDYYEFFTPKAGSGKPILGFFKSISVKVAHFLHIGPSASRKAKVDHGLLSQVLRGSNIEAECPRTVALDYMKKFYSSQPDAESHSMADNLSYAAKLSGQLDRLQKTPKLKSDDKRLTEITNSMTRHVDVLKEGQKLLVPGGWWSEGKFHDGLIEATKQKAGDYTVRFISTDQEMHQYSPRVVDPLTNKVATCPHFTYENVSKEQLNASLTPLIQMQITSLIENPTEKVSWKDKLISRVLALMSSDGDSGEGEAPEISEKLESSSIANPLFVMSAYYGRKEPTISQVDIDQALDVEQRLGTSAGGNTVKNVLTFYKLQQPHLYESTKLQLQISTFVELTERCDGMLEDTQLRHAVSDSARRLRHELGKTRAADLVSLEARDFLLDKISKVQDRVAEAELAATTSPKAMKEWHVEAPMGEVRSDAFEKLTSVEPVKSSAIDKQSGVTDCSSFFANTIEPSDISSQLTTRLEACQKLYDAGSFQLLQELVVDTTQKLPLITEFNAPDRESAEAAKLEEQLCQLTQYLLEINLATDQKEPPFEVIVSATKLDAMIDSVCLEENFGAKQPPSFISFNQLAAKFETGGMSFIPHKDELTALENYWHIREKKSSAGSIDLPNIIKKAGIKGGPDRSKRVARMFVAAKMSEIVLTNRQMVTRDRFGLTRSPIPPHPLSVGTDCHRKMHQLEVKNSNSSFSQWTLQLDTKHYVHSQFVQALDSDSWQVSSFDAGNYGASARPPLGFSVKGAIGNQQSDLSEAEIMNKYENPIQRNLMLCQVGTTSLQVSRRINTFLSHPEYFDDPSLVGFFEDNVLGANLGSYLGDQLWDNPGVLDHLGECMEREYQVAVQSGNLLRACTLLEMGIKIRNSIEVAYPDKNSTLRKKADGTSIAEKLPGLDQWKVLQERFNNLHSKAATEEEKTFISMQQLAWASRAWKAGLIQKSDLPIKELVAGSFIVSSGPRTAHTANKDLRYECESLLHRLSSDIPKLNQADRQDLAKKILANAKISVPQDTIKGDFPIWQLGDYQIDFERGLIFTNGSALGTLSDQVAREVKNQPMAEALWTKPLSTDGKMQLGRSKDNTELIFFTPNSHPDLRLVVQPGISTRIQRKVVDSKGKETFFDLVALGSPPPIKTLLDNCTVWVDPADTNRAVALARGATQPAYELKFKADEKGNPSIDSVKRVKDGLTLMTIQDALSSDPEYGQLFGLEVPEHTVLWGNGSKPSSVEYPRLKMSDGKPLSYQITQEKISGTNRPTLVPEVSQLQGWKVDLMGNVIKGVEGILPPTFEQFQLLQSPKGNPKVVFSLQKLLPYDPDKAGNVVRHANATPWLNRAYFDRNVDSTSAQKTVIAEMDLQSKKLKTTSKESMAMVAYVFFAHKDYEQASDYLNKSIAASALSSDHKNILRWAIEWPDNTPEAAAFKLKAAVALVESERKFGDPANLKLPLLMELVQHYRLNEENVPISQKLSEEQLSLAHEISQMYIDETDVLSSAKEVKPTLEETLEGPQAAMTFYCNAAKQHPFHNEPIPVVPDKFLEEHFISMYDWLKSPKHLNQKSAVVASLNGCRPTTPLGESLRRYLLAAADGKADAPPFPKEYSKQQGLFDGFAPVRMLKMVKAGENKLPPALDALTQFFTAMDAKVVVPKEVDPSTIPEPKTVPERFAKGEALAEPRVADGIAKEYLQENPAYKVAPMIFSEAQQKQTRVLPVSESAGLFAALSAKQRSSLDVSGLVKANDDPATQRLINEVIADTEEYRKSPLAETYQFNDPAAVAKLKTDTNQALSAAANTRKEAEGKILSQLNLRIQTKGVAHVQTEKLTKIPDRLFGLYAQNKMDDVGHLLGARISKEEAMELDTLMEAYMKTAIQERLLTQLSQRLDSVPKAVGNTDPALVNDIRNLLSTTRFYSLEPGEARHPLARKLLLIEHGSFVLRQGQVRTHEVLFSGDNRLRQLAMGGGKTLLVPTLLNEYADGVHLAEAILPAWLEEITGDEIDNICGSVYGQHLHRFKYIEEKADNIDWLKDELATLEKTIKNRGAVLTTREHKLNFRNKHLEALHVYNQTGTPEAWEKLQVLNGIVNIGATRTRTIADEVDSTLDVRQKCIRAIEANNQKEPPKLPTQMYTTGVEVFNILAAWSNKDSGISENLRKFSAALQSNRQAELYEGSAKEIKQALAGEMYKNWAAKWPAEVKVSEENFIQYLLGDTTDGLKAQLTCNAKGIPQFMEKLQQSNPEEYRNVCYAKQFISKTMDSTFMLSNNVRYGRGEDGVTTRPYVAVNKPTTDKFGNPYEEVMLHCQDYMQAGLNNGQVIQFLKEIQKGIESEMNNARLDGKILAVEDTKVYERFYSNPEFQEINLTRALRDPEEAKRLQDIINSSPAAKLDFALKWVLPFIKTTSRQITSGPFDLTGMSKNFNGFSGTPWNLDAYSKELDKSLIKDVGTDGKTVDFVLSAFKDGRLGVKTMTEFDERKPVESIVNQEGFWDRYDTLIDAGAYIRGPSNDEVAKALGDNVKGTKKTAVAFVDNEDKLVLQEFGSDIKVALGDRKDVPVENRFNFYAQANSIGTDMPNGTTARAALTIGEDTTFFKAAQAIWRMRGLSEKGQQFDIFLKPEVAKLIRPEAGDVTAQDVLHFLLQKQAEQESKDNFVADTERIQGIMPAQLHASVLASIAKGEKPSREMLDLSEKYLYTNTEENIEDLARIGGTQKATENLQTLKDDQLKLCEDIQKDLGYQPEFLENAKAKLSDYEILAENKLPDVVDRAGSSNEGARVQQKQQQKQQQQQQQQVQASEAVVKGAPIETPWVNWPFVLHLPPVSERNHADIAEPISLNRQVKWMDPDILHSRNFGTDLADLTRSNRKQLNRLVIFKDSTGKTQALMIDLIDFKNIIEPLDLKKLQKPIGGLYDRSAGSQLAVYEINSSGKRAFVQGKGTTADHMLIKGDPFKDDKRVIELVAISKLWAGQCVFYDKDERESILKFLKSKSASEVAEIKETFEKLMSPEQRKQYNEGSTIYQFFHANDMKAAA